ncbi:MAG: flagellar motor protein MotB [Pirellulales bacterium]|nr:flagellar motor protein MotB [Pirellulales bacterium]
MAIEPEETPGVPEWLVTFGDMMSLLLTFFIMLFSMSEIRQEQKFQAMLESMRKAFGHDMSMLTSVPGPHTPQNSNFAKLASLGRARRANIMKGGAPVKAPVGSEPRVMSLRPDGDPTTAGLVFFREGSDELTEAAKKTLQSLARQIEGMPQRIEIRGHTSNRPLAHGSPFRDHWDLAYARARKVEAFLVKLGIDPERIRLGVAAGNELKYDGTDRLRQEENPRVEVLMTNETIESQHAPKPDSS